MNQTPDHRPSLQPAHTGVLDVDAEFARIAANFYTTEAPAQNAYPEQIPTGINENPLTEDEINAMFAGDGDMVFSSQDDELLREAADKLSLREGRKIQTITGEVKASDDEETAILRAQAHAFIIGQMLAHQALAKEMESDDDNEGSE